jgi:hypothetical protein
MKAKPVLLVIGTLILGFVLGMLTSAQIRLHKLSPVRVFFSEERFRDGFYKTIQPDEKQKAEIELILDKYAKINSDLQDNFHKDMDLNMNEFRKEIDSNLSKEQLARLKEMDERRQQMVRHNMRTHSTDSLGNRGNRMGNPKWGRMQNGPPPPAYSERNPDSVKSPYHK